MKVIILAAGYATRLYPLTLKRPKPLLAVAGKPMIDYVLDNLATISGIDRVLHRHQREVCRAVFKNGPTIIGPSKPNSILPSSTTARPTMGTSSGPLAICTLFSPVKNSRTTSSWVAGDNLFSETLGGFGHFLPCKEKAPVLAVYDVGNLEEIKKIQRHHHRWDF